MRSVGGWGLRRRSTYSRAMVRVEWRDRVLVVTIDRPERRNAVDHATLLALADAQRQATEGDARALVLTGAPPAFCAGADLTGVENGEFVEALVRSAARLHDARDGRRSPPSTGRRSGPAPNWRSRATSASRRRRACSASRLRSSGLAVDRWTVDRVAARVRRQRRPRHAARRRRPTPPSSST